MNSLVVPIVLWGNRPPTHNIQTVEITCDGASVVTGCRDGQICVWDRENGFIYPKMMLFGHSSSIVCITAIQPLEDNDKRELIASVSASGEVFLWDIHDGKCLEQSKIEGAPLAIKFYTICNGTILEPSLLCYGQFAEVFILNALTLQTTVTLVARIYPDWINSASILFYDKCIAVVGLTMAGTVKVWEIPKGTLLPSQPILEDESKQLRCCNVISFSYSSYAGNILLVIAQYEWQLYDAGDFSLLCTVPSYGGNTFQGGEFLSSNCVAVWDSDGIVYFYKIPFTLCSKESYRTHFHSTGTNPTPKLISSLKSEKQELSRPPNMQIKKLHDKTFILYGDSNSNVVLWSLGSKGDFDENFIDNIKILAANSLTKHWDSLPAKPAGIVDCLNHVDNSISASLYLEVWGLIICGKDDGSIVLVAAAKALKVHLLQDEQSKKGFLPHKTLRGHHGRVTSLLYPHEVASRYSSQILVSGSADFSVILWDMFTGSQLHTFHIHGGEVTQLLVPPKACSPRILNSICSVAADHSVALLSIRERKCVMLAACHPSPVVVIKWKPFEDFMMVACSDGSLYVWQMETGHLDRHITGITVSEILAACETERSDIVLENETNFSQVFKKRNFSAFKAAAEQGLKNIIDNIDDKFKNERSDLSNADVVSKCTSMWVQPLRASPTHDSDMHVVFFNIETLIGNLLQEHALMKKKTKQMKGSSKEPSVAKKVFTAFISQVRNQILDFSDPNLSSSPDLPKRNQQMGKHNKKSTKVLDVIALDTPMDRAQVLLSCLHGWGLDERLDVLCKEKLGIYTPISTVCFGLLSREGHICLMLPTAINHKSSNWKIQTKTIHGIPCHVFVENPNLTRTELSKIEYTKHWEISSSLTTQHLIGVIAIANTMMELSNSGFLDYKQTDQTYGTSEVSDNYGCTPGEMAQAKQGWSLLATLHCILLPDLVNLDKYKPPKLELLARRWQDRCLEVREAAQALLLAKLRQIGLSGRKLVVHEWVKHMPDYIDYTLPTHLQQNNGTVDAMSDRVKSPYRTKNQTSHANLAQYETNSNSSTQDLTSMPSSSQTSVKLSSEKRRKQAIAIIILGVMGSEFGTEATSAASTPENGNADKIAFARQTCRALVYLLLQTPSPRLPAHAPIRRAAIDLLGRGFTVWEPYIETSAVLLGLLELCIKFDLHIASIHSGLPLSAEADSCRSAHHALCLIASARPLTFIATIAREVARHNAAATNPQHQAFLATSVLVRAKHEVLQIIDLLADKMMNEISELIVEVVDIILFCLDSAALKSNQTLVDAFPVLAKFHNVSLDAKSKRLAIGKKDGSIVMHDLRSNKHTTVAGGRSRITALAFSPEGKYLGVYSMQDNQLCLWMASTSLFGIIQSQIKCVKTIHPLPPAIRQKISDKNCSYKYQKDGISLVWVSNRVVVLLLGDGSEYRCHV